MRFITVVLLLALVVLVALAQAQNTLLCEQVYQKCVIGCKTERCRTLCAYKYGRCVEQRLGGGGSTPAPKPIKVPYFNKL